jgi:phenylpropionate dioxygenase-like ring-hydroxylating dioxygenase large terminal subunit
MSLDRALEHFWHPVCTLDEVAAAAPRPIAVRLLGRRLAVADLGGTYAALDDRCLHRSTRLSVGSVDGGAIRCAYHGWRWAANGHCIEIPSMPDGPIPARACVAAYEAAPAYGLLWVRIDASVDTRIPVHPAFDDPAMRIVMGGPYTWPVGAPRRVENFVDLAHFAWVHDGSLGRRDEPVPELPRMRREAGELRFEYEPPDRPVSETALFGFSRYRMPMPLTVNIAFDLASGARRHLWMTAAPLDLESCRCFWFVSRDDDVDGDDGPHLDFQQLVLSEDEPVVCNQDPPELPLEAGVELSVRTDRVSIEYRRWLRELAGAAGRGPEELEAALRSDSVTTVPA